MFRRLLVVPMAALLAVPMAPTAWADYSTEAVSHLSTDNRIYVDPGASPMLPRADELNDQIKFSAVPLWIVNVAGAYTDDRAEISANVVTDPIRDALYDTHNPITDSMVVDGSDHQPPLIILVIDGNGYHAWSYDVTADVAAQTGPNITIAASHHFLDLYGTVSEYISLMAGIPGNGQPGAVSSPRSAPPVDPAPLGKVSLGVFWIIVASAGLWMFVALRRGRFERAKQRRERRYSANPMRRNTVPTYGVLTGLDDVSSHQANATQAHSAGGFDGCGFSGGFDGGGFSGGFDGGGSAGFS